MYEHKKKKQPNRSTKPWGASELAKLRREYPVKNTANRASVRLRNRPPYTRVSMGLIGPPVTPPPLSGGGQAARG